jgi:hypothetical protein
MLANNQPPRTRYLPPATADPPQRRTRLLEQPNRDLSACARLRVIYRNKVRPDCAVHAVKISDRAEATSTSSEMPFQPAICDCSYAQYRHVVKSQTDWERHQAKARSDRLQSALLNETARLPLAPGLQRTQKRAPSPEDSDVEDNEPPVMRKSKRQLRDVDLSRVHLHAGDVDYVENAQQVLQASEEPPVRQADEEPLVLSTEELGARNIEDDAKLCRIARDEPVFLPPGCQLEDNGDADDTDADYDDADTSDDEMFDLMVGAMRRGYEEEEEGEEEEGQEEDEEDEGEEDEQEDEEHGIQDGEHQLSYADQSPSFDYRQLVGDPLTAKEILSLSMHGIYRKYKTQRRCIDEIGDVMGRVLGSENKPHVERTVNRHIEQRTGVKGVKYDCCPESHMSYAMYPEDTECRVCHHPRWKTTTNLRGKKATERQIPYAQHLYIPLTHRIRLWWSNPIRAEKMIQYRNTTAMQGSGEGKSADFWTGKLVQDLKKRDADSGARTPMFSQDTDLAFFFSTDGVKVFKSRRAFHIWPLLLINLNLPPAERVKRCNMILVGFIPGPKEPNDLDSFLFPLIQEMKMLEKGFPDGFNAARTNTAEETFLLRAYIVCVGADMIGRTKV